MKKVAIFLDFDGVFHPLMGSTKHFCDLKNFETVMKEYSQILDIDFIISSSWKNRYSIEEIKSFFSKEIAEKIIGFTVEKTTGDGSRYASAQEFMKNSNYDYWLALDDDHYAWNRVENLVWCHDEVKDREVAILKERLDKLA